MKQYIFGLFLCLVLFSSCEEKEPLDAGTGFLYISASKNIDVITKAEADLEPMSVAICKAATGDTVQFFKDYATDLGNEKVQLPAGKYYVKAGTIHSGKAAFDKPFYSGADTIEVVKATIRESEVVCMLANVKVTVAYSDLLKRFFTGYKATISNPSGALTFEEKENRAGYYTPGKLNVVLDLINNDGTHYQIVKEISGTKAREHYRLTFSVGEEPDSPEAGGEFEVTVDETTNDINCELKVPVFTDDHGRNVPKIEVNSSNINDEKIISIIEKNEKGETLQIALSAEKTGIQLLGLKLKSQFFQTDCQLPEYIDLANIDAVTKTNLEKTGITYTTIAADGSTRNASLDFNGLLSKEMISIHDPKPILNNITIIVRDKFGQQIEEHFIVRIRPNIAVQTLDPTPWPYRAYLKGLAGDNTDLGFKYRKAGEDDTKWQTVTVDPLNVKLTDDGYEFFGLIKGLSMISQYEYKAIAGETEGNIKTFTTEGTPVVPNLNFENWIQSGKTWYANSIGDKNNANFWWDSGNDGANTMGEKNPTNKETSLVKEGKAAKLHSQFVGVGTIGAFAAASLFTGKFVDTDGMGGILDFGRSYAGHPTKMKGYYHYTSGKVDYAKQGLNTGDQDICSIYIALCAWDSPRQINTNNASSFIDYTEKNPTIVAYGSFETKESSSAYQEFSIDLKYYRPELKPTYIVIVFSASKYGDYFTGSTGSTLYIDECELLFDDPSNSN